VIVGPRSALFTPLPNPGLIVIDECHDPAYYQEDMQPNYDAVEAAICLRPADRSVLILGSATPEVSLYYRAQQERWPMLQLPVRILAHRKGWKPSWPNWASPKTLQPRQGEGDCRAQPAAGQSHRHAPGAKSRQPHHLQPRAARSPAAGAGSRPAGHPVPQPARHGHLCLLPAVRLQPEVPALRSAADLHTSTRAGWSATPATTAGSAQNLPGVQQPQIRHFGTGTEKVESDVQALFPRHPHPALGRGNHPPERRARPAAAGLLNHQADVLIGTQMLAKGLDLPLVTLVGVVLADVGLQLPDYNAGERTFQLLTQVAGRAGRSPLGGRVILQTFQPEHYAIRAAAAARLCGLLPPGMAYRKRLRYPPFARLVRLEVSPQPAPGRRRGAADGPQLKAGSRGRPPRHGDDRPGAVLLQPPEQLYRWQIVLRGPTRPPCCAGAAWAIGASKWSQQPL
jgi:primosomal protein N' (replication factor Y) (superfamily II helicase)